MEERQWKICSENISKYGAIVGNKALSRYVRTVDSVEIAGCSASELKSATSATGSGGHNANGGLQQAITLVPERNCTYVLVSGHPPQM